MIDFGQRRDTRGGEEIRLTRTEYDLLARLARGGGRVFTTLHARHDRST